MNLNPASRVKLKITGLATNFDPGATTTVEIGVDDTFYPAAFIGTTVKAAGAAKWTSTAETTGWFAGPEATANGATVLALGAHKIEARLTTGGQVVVFKTDALTVAE